MTFDDGYTTNLYSGSTGTHIQSINRSRDWGMVVLLTFSSNGALAIGTKDGTISIWHIGFRHLHPQILQCNIGVCDAVFSPDGTYIASTHINNNIIL